MSLGQGINNIINHHQPDFSKTILYSLIVHFFFILIAVLSSLGTQKKVFITPVLSVDLSVSMPKASKKIAEPPAPAESDNKEKLSDVLKKLRDKVAAQEDAKALSSKIASLKKDTNTKKTQAQKDKEQEAVNKLKAKLKVAELKSQTVSALAEIPARSEANRKITKELYELKFREYYMAVGERVKSQWIYSGDKTEKLVALLGIKVAPDGKLLLSVIEKSSGNRNFDISAINAIKKAAPLPPLPEEINKEALTMGLRFCPAGCN